MIKIILFIFLAFLCAAPLPAETPLQKATFTPHWVPQSQFAGYFMAYEQGIYKKYGIDLAILTGGPRNPTSTALEKGNTDFALLWLTNAIQLRSHGIPVVNIAQIVHRSALMLVAKKSSGIRKPADFNGKKIGIWGGDFQIQPKAFFKKFNAAVRLIPQQNSINLFLLNGVDATSAMWYNEYNSIVNSGYDPADLITFRFSDYGLNFPEEGIYCLEKTLRDKPDLCEAFVKASIEGWLYAFNNKEETLKIVILYAKKANLSVNKAHQRWMLECMRELIIGQDGKTIDTKLKEQDYIFVGNILQTNGSITSVPAFDSFQKHFFVQDVK